jgi:hypothetical protein
MNPTSPPTAAVTRVTRAVVLALLVSVAALAGACGTPKLTADSTCQQYLQRPGQERSDTAIRLSSELRAADAGNPMWALNLDYTCGQGPSQTLRGAFGK